MLAITKDLQVIKVGKGRPIAGRRLLALIIEPTDSSQVSSILTSHLLTDHETLKELPPILQDVSHKYRLPQNRWSEEPQLPSGEMYTFSIKALDEQTVREALKRAFGGLNDEDTHFSTEGLRNGCCEYSSKNKI